MYCNITVIAISYLAKCIKHVLLEFLPLTSESDQESMVCCQV